MSTFPHPKETDATRYRLLALMSLRMAYYKRTGKMSDYDYLHELYDNWPEAFENWAEQRDDITIETH